MEDVTLLSGPERATGSRAMCNHSSEGNFDQKGEKSPNGVHEISQSSDV